MTAFVQQTDHRWRTLRWSAAAGLLCIPAVAMLFTDEVRWSAFDFVVMATLLAAVLLGYEAFARRCTALAYRIGAIATIAGLFGMVWLNLAVGIIGSEQNDANMLFALPIATIVGGAILSRLAPRALSVALLLAAGETAVIAASAAVFGWAAGTPDFPADVIGASAIFVALWLAAATAFAHAARAR